MVYFFLIVGFLLLWFGSALVQRGGAGLVTKLRLPQILVSLVVVSLAMSAPELSVAIQGVRSGMPDMALGTIIGGSLANLLLVIGLGALIAPMPAPPRTVFRDSATLVVVSLAVMALLLANSVNRIAGYVLVGAWLFYLVLAYVTELGRPQQSFAIDPDVANRRDSATLSVFLACVGVAALFFGARYTVDFAALAARLLHVPTASMALVVVAFGTTIPELSATITSARRGYSFAATAQLLASCIFNLLLVLGVVAVMHPPAISSMLAHFAAPLLAGTAFVVALFMLFGWRISRPQGFVLFAGYIGLLATVCWRSGLFRG